jgi:hypothetical protein
MDPYVSVTKYKGKAVVDVRIGQNHLRYPLTKAGCLAAGRDIFKGFNGEVDSWMNSSSVDFPQEVKPGFKWDVRELMSQGFQEELDKAEAPRKSLVKKIMALVLKDEQFLMALPPEEFKAWEVLQKRIAAE